MKRKDKEKKTKTVKIRVTDKEFEELELAVEKSGMTRTDVLLKGLNLYGRILKYQE